MLQNSALQRISKRIHYLNIRVLEFFWSASKTPLTLRGVFVLERWRSQSQSAEAVPAYALPVVRAKRGLRWPRYLNNGCLSSKRGWSANFNFVKVHSLMVRALANDIELFSALLGILAI